MAFRLSDFSRFVRLGVIGLGISNGADAADGLADTSPFMPVGAPGETVVTTSDGSALELRGLIVTDDGPKFSIYDPNKHLSTWVGLDEKGRDFTVRSYDSGRDTVAVDFQGQSLTLALRSAKIAPAPVEDMAPPTIPRPMPSNDNIGVNPTPADEQRRLEAIAAEVNRRRALRQKALQEQRRMREEARRPVVPAQP